MSLKAQEEDQKMVDYYIQKTVPANTSKANAVYEDFFLPSGVMHSGVVDFPAGCHNLAHCTINEAVHQIWPSDPSKNYAGEFFPIEIPDRYIILQPFTKITAWFWNEDTRNDHEVTVKFTVSTPEEFEPIRRQNTLFERFLKRIGA